jgi:hypothetical protein
VRPIGQRLQLNVAFQNTIAQSDVYSWARSTAPGEAGEECKPSAAALDVRAGRCTDMRSGDAKYARHFPAERASNDKEFLRNYGMAISVGSCRSGHFCWTHRHVISAEASWTDALVILLSSPWLRVSRSSAIT